MVHTVRGNHEAAAAQRDQDLGHVRGEPVAPPCRKEDEADADCHQQRNNPFAMPPVALDKSQRPKACDKHGKGAVGALLGWKKVRGYRG